MLEIMIGDKFVDPIVGVVTLEDVSPHGDAVLRVDSSGFQVFRTLEVLETFECVGQRPGARRPALVLAFGAFIFASACAAGVYYGF